MLVLGPTFQESLNANSMELNFSLGPLGNKKALVVPAPGVTSEPDQRPEPDGLHSYVFWIHLTDKQTPYCLSNKENTDP